MYAKNQVIGLKLFKMELNRHVVERGMIVKY